MLRVTVEFVGQYPQTASVLREIEIINTGRGTQARGNYTVRPTFDWVADARIEDHPRDEDLLRLVAKACDALAEAEGK